MYRYTRPFHIISEDRTASTNWADVPTNKRGQRLWLNILYPLEFGYSIQFDNEEEFLRCQKNTKNLHYRLRIDGEEPRGFKSNRKELSYMRVRARMNQNAMKFRCKA